MQKGLKFISAEVLQYDRGSLGIEFIECANIRHPSRMLKLWTLFEMKEQRTNYFERDIDTDQPPSKHASNERVDTTTAESLRRLTDCTRVIGASGICRKVIY
jgi:hypothetical protein